MKRSEAAVSRPTLRSSCPYNLLVKRRDLECINSLLSFNISETDVTNEALETRTAWSELNGDVSPFEIFLTGEHTGPGDVARPAACADREAHEEYLLDD